LFDLLANLCYLNAPVADARVRCCSVKGMSRASASSSGSGSKRKASAALVVSRVGKAAKKESRSATVSTDNDDGVQPQEAVAEATTVDEDPEDGTVIVSF